MQSGHTLDDPAGTRRPVGTVCAWCDSAKERVATPNLASWGICWDCLLRYFPSVISPEEKHRFFPEAAGQSHRRGNV